MSNCPDDDMAASVIFTRLITNQNKSEDLEYAKRLAQHLNDTHFDNKDFQLLPTMNGVLSQIDNMICAWPANQQSVWERCVNCHHELLPETPLDSLGNCVVRMVTPDGDAHECGCHCVFKSAGEQEPSLEDLAAEAATLLDGLPNYTSDSTIRQAAQMAFALRQGIKRSNAIVESLTRQRNEALDQCVGLHERLAKERADTWAKAIEAAAFHDVIWLPEPENLALVLLAEIERLNPTPINRKSEEPE